MAGGQGKNNTRRVDFNAHLTALSNMTPEQRAEWNREGMRKSEMYWGEKTRRGRSNIQKYLARPGAEQTLISGDSITGELTLKWQIQLKTKYSVMEVELQAGDLSNWIKIAGGFEECNRVAVKRFVDDIERHVLRAAEQLIVASDIYSREVVSKSNPHRNRENLLKREMDYSERATGKTKAGRNSGTYMSPLRRESASKKFAEKVKRAIRNLYLGKTDRGGSCKDKHRGECPGHLAEEIDRSLVASYLGISSAAVLGNQLRRNNLTFRSLKKEALENITK
jgi:hypothetical protein